MAGSQENQYLLSIHNLKQYLQIFNIEYLNKNQICVDLNYPSEAISAGIATAIRPIAAVAVSSEVLTTF